MTTVAINASDPLDSFTRYWIITFDQPPAQNWGQDANSGYEVHKSGDTMTGSQDLSDGPHKVFFQVWQSGGPAIGTYSGSAVFDGAAQSAFNSVTKGVSAQFDITVKNGLVTAENTDGGGSSSSSGSSSNSAGSTIKQSLTNLKSKITGNKMVQVAIIGTVAAVVTVGVIIGLKKKRRF